MWCGVFSRMESLRVVFSWGKARWQESIHHQSAESINHAQEATTCHGQQLATGAGQLSHRMPAAERSSRQLLGACPIGFSGADSDFSMDCNFLLVPLRVASTLSSSVFSTGNHLNTEKTIHSVCRLCATPFSGGTTANVASSKAARNGVS